VKVLVVNAGSSSVKFSLMETGDRTRAASGSIERIGYPGTHLKVEASDGRLEDRAAPEVTDARGALERIAAALTEGPASVVKDLGGIEAVGHRVVQGADLYSDSVLIDARVKAAVGELSCLAPLHNPANLAGIEAAEEILADAPQVAVFDTAFHSTIPPRAHLYGLPVDFARRHRLRRYGFHGTSHKFVSQRAREMLGSPEHSKIVTAHIGNGISLCAVRDGASVDTTMGFTPLEGVVMGTRSGSIDPGLVLYLVDGLGRSPDDIDRLLNKESGLLGMAGIGSGDLRDVLVARTRGNEKAAVAFDVYVYRLAQAVGAMATAMEGIDALCFTAGAGENSPALRAAVCERVAFLGIELDAKTNEAARGDADISSPGARARTFVVTTREDVVIALETARVAGGRR